MKGGQASMCSLSCPEFRPEIALNKTLEFQLVKGGTVVRSIQEAAEPVERKPGTKFKRGKPFSFL